MFYQTPNKVLFHMTSNSGELCGLRWGEPDRFYHTPNKVLFHMTSNSGELGGLRWGEVKDPARTLSLSRSESCLELSFLSFFSSPSFRSFFSLSCLCLCLCFLFFFFFFFALWDLLWDSPPFDDRSRGRVDRRGAAGVGVLRTSTRHNYTSCYSEENMRCFKL